MIFKSEFNMAKHFYLFLLFLLFFPCLSQANITKDLFRALRINNYYDLPEVKYEDVVRVQKKGRDLGRLSKSEDNSYMLPELLSSPVMRWEIPSSDPRLPPTKYISFLLKNSRSKQSKYLIITLEYINVPFNFCRKVVKEYGIHNNDYEYCYEHIGSWDGYWLWTTGEAGVVEPDEYFDEHGVRIFMGIDEEGSFKLTPRTIAIIAMQYRGSSDTEKESFIKHFFNTLSDLDKKFVPSCCDDLDKFNCAYYNKQGRIYYSKLTGDNCKKMPNNHIVNDFDHIKCFKQCYSQKGYEMPTLEEAKAQHDEAKLREKKEVESAKSEEESWFDSLCKVFL